MPGLHYLSSIEPIAAMEYFIYIVDIMRGVYHEVQPMHKIVLLLLGLTLMLLFLSVSASEESEYTPISWPSLETAFKVPERGSWYSPSGMDNAASLKVPITWLSPTSSNYTEHLKMPEWKSWTSPSSTDYLKSLTVPEWKSWKPISGPSWDTIFRIPWR